MNQNLLLKTCLLLVLSILTFSCKTAVIHRPEFSSHRSNQSLSPGHAKKIAGHQSAKAFATGQQKKRSQGHGTIYQGNAAGINKKKK